MVGGREKPSGRGGRGPAGVGGPRRASGASTLADLRVGQSGEVVAVEAPDQAGYRRLFALGLVPGARVTLLQRFPTYVFTVGRTTIAVDREMARGVGVAAFKTARHPPRANAVEEQTPCPTWKGISAEAPIHYPTSQSWHPLRRRPR